MRRNLLGMVLAVTLSCLAGITAAAPATGDALSLAVVPQFPALDIHRAWTPLATALESAIGRPVQLKIYPSIPAFEEDFLAGKPDLVYLNPYHMAIAYRARGYLPLLRDGAQQLSGILVVQAGSPVTSVEQLKGLAIAFPAPNAFGASLLIRALLTDQHRIGFQAIYVKTHSNAYRAVARGEMAAAGGIRSSLEREPEDLRARLKVLYETPRYAAHPVAAHPRLGAEVRASVVRAFMQLRATGEGRLQLAAILMAEPVAADFQRDYGSLEKLGLERYVVREH